MSRVGQISIARPGLPLQLRFEEKELKSVLENEAQPGDHVTLYPGDFSTWYDFDESPYTEDTPVEVRKGISVTILPGAVVDYFTDETKTYRDENFSHEGEPFDSLNSGDRDHPLSESANPAKRYEVPNFTGHIENIADQNLASEWAFETDLEKLRTAFENRNEKGTKIGITTNNQVSTPEIELGETLEFRELQNVNISTERTATGIGVDVEFDRNSIIQIDAGRNLTSRNVDGEVTIEHEVIIPKGSSNNSGTEFIQSLFFKNGHVKNVESAEFATLNERKPRTSDGEEGDIWLVEEEDIVFDIYLSTDEPTQFDGEEGDVWFIDEQLTPETRAAGTFYFSDATPNQPQGQNGQVWLDVEGWVGTDFETDQIEEIVHKNQSPTSSNGDEGDIYSTTERIV